MVAVGEIVPVDDALLKDRSEKGRAARQQLVVKLWSQLGDNYSQYTTAHTTRLGKTPMTLYSPTLVSFEEVTPLYRNEKTFFKGALGVPIGMSYDRDNAVWMLVVIESRTMSGKEMERDMAIYIPKEVEGSKPVLMALLEEVCPAKTTRKEWIPVDVDGADVLLPVLAMDMHLRMRHWGFLDTDLQSEARVMGQNLKDNKQHWPFAQNKSKILSPDIEMKQIPQTKLIHGPKHLESRERWVYGLNEEDEQSGIRLANLDSSNVRDIEESIVREQNKAPVQMELPAEPKASRRRVASGFRTVEKKQLQWQTRRQSPNTWMPGGMQSSC